jgi:hypothetical protein
MANPVIPYDGKIGINTVLLGQLMSGGLTAFVRLYQNNYVPVAGTLNSDFVECTWPGYAGQPTPAAVDQGINGLGQDVWQFGPTTFGPATGTPSQVVYGYWVEFVDPVSHAKRVWFAQQFDVPFGVTAAGQTVGFTMTWSDNQGP